MLSDLLNKTGIVYRKSKGSKNSFRESGFSLSAVITDLACTIQPAKADLTFTVGGTTYTVTSEVYCAYRSDILPGDYIEIDSVRYLVGGPLDDGGRGHHLKIYVTKV